MPITHLCNQLGPRLLRRSVNAIFTLLGCYAVGRTGCAETSVTRLRLKSDGTRAETRFRLSAKRTSPSKSAGASVQSTTGSRNVRISGSNGGYTMFRGSMKGTGYPFHSPVPLHFPSRTLLCAITFQLESTNNPSNAASRLISFICS